MKVKDVPDEFERWADEEESRIKDAETKTVAEVHRGNAVTARKCAEFIRERAQ